MVTNFYWICYVIFILFGVLLHKSHIWKKSFFWNIGQNSLSQSDYRIFKSTISPDQIDEIASFFACWYKFTEIKSWSKIFGWTWSKMFVVNLKEHMELTDFLQAVKNPSKLKSDFKIFGWALSKIGVASLVMGL